jgi:hypothetical protein
MKLTVEHLQRKIQNTETLAEFGNPIGPRTHEYLLESGLSEGWPVFCMQWIWFQWLAAGPVDEIRTRVEAVVDRGMALQDLTSLLQGRPSHDLFLLHCAIFASPETQLRTLAERVVNASGFGEQKPKNDGELYESAWCGMVKHWILGDRKKAIEQADIVWKAYRFPNLRATTKPLVTPWLNEDWDSFRKQQQKDFKKLWDRIRKDRWRPILKETGEEVVVSVERFNGKQSWCWAHCGLALLAHRRGVHVATDAFWFPLHALKCAPG